MDNPRVHAEAQSPRCNRFDDTPYPALPRTTMHARRRIGPVTLSTLAGLLVATTASCVDGSEIGDCAPSAVHANIDGQPLTRAERIARLDEALNDSLARFDECQDAASAGADPDAGAGSTGRDAAGTDGGASGVAGAADGARDAETAEATEPTAGGAAVDSVAAAGVEGTEAPEDAGETTPGTERPPSHDSGAGSGQVPDDIPEPDNDSVLEAQIRRAAMEETDPRIRAELWNEYRRYKGLPTKPLPDDDGEPSDAQISQ